MPVRRFGGVEPPSAPPEPYYPVRVLRLDEPVDVTFLHERILGQMCHWVFDPEKSKSRSRVCLDFQGECPYCGVERKVWLGWTPIFNNGSNLREVLSLGAEGGKCLAMINGPFGGLILVRRTLTLRQVGQTRRVMIGDAHSPPRQHLTAHNIVPTVKRLLGTDVLDLDGWAPDDVPTVPLPPAAEGGAT